MMNEGETTYDISELFSPPRVGKVGEEHGLRRGFAFDKEWVDEVTGHAWDFNSITMSNKAVRRVLEDKPLLLIGCPMCTIYSSMNQINHAKMSSEEVSTSRVGMKEESHLI